MGIELSSPSSLCIDSFEPTDMETWLKQMVPVERKALNGSGWADYCWATDTGYIYQIARETPSAILSGFDGVENELLKSLDVLSDDEGNTLGELALLIEGVIVSTSHGINTFVQSDNGQIFHRGFTHGSKTFPQHALYTRLMSWLWSINYSGVSVYFTATPMDSAKAIAAFYNKSQQPREEHDTLRRYLKPKHQPWMPNCHVANLLALRMSGNKPIRLGRDKAEELIDTFGTFAAVIAAPIDTVATICGSRKIAENIFNAVGKDY
jgi:hypothetical protein